MSEADRTPEELSERKKLILKAIIDAHIAGGEPVGSKYLVESKQIACSSATIRNEMAELEAMGYLEQPHASAGRVPQRTRVPLLCGLPDRALRHDGTRDRTDQPVAAVQNGRAGSDSADRVARGIQPDKLYRFRRKTRHLIRECASVRRSVPG